MTMSIHDVPKDKGNQGDFYKLSMESVERYYLDEGGHGFDHIRRVHRMAMWIAGKTGADLEIVNAAALLHDVARSRQHRGECTCHAREGARMAGRILADNGFDENEITRVSHCIAVHRFSKQRAPETLEARVLQDADRLDALGAICIARVFMYNGLHRLPLYEASIRPEKEYRGQHTTAINHFHEKILKIRPDLFHTEPARVLARRRYERIERFVKDFMDEWHGMDFVMGDEQDSGHQSPPQ